MAAIITEEFRRQSHRLFRQDITSNNYYIGIGKSDDWSETVGTNEISPFPFGTIADQQRVRDNLTGLFKVTNITDIIPKNTIVSGRKYKVFNQYDPTAFYASETTNEYPCYVTSNFSEGNSGNHVFLCLAKTNDAIGVNSSAVRLGSGSIGELPAVNTFGIYQFDDGYTWAYLGVYNVSNQINSNAFISFNFEQNASQSSINATNGLLYNINVIYSPTIQTLPETLNIRVSGIKTNGQYTEYDISSSGKLEGGKLTKVYFSLFNNTNLLNWTKSVKVSITNTGFENVKLAASVAPSTGFEKNLSTCLPSWYVGFYADTSVASYIPDNTFYRQVSLIKNPNKLSGDPIDSGLAFVNPLSYFTLTQSDIPKIGAIDIGPGTLIMQNDDEIGSISYIQQLQDQTYRYYYSTNQETGFKNILTGIQLVFKKPNGTNSDIVTVVAGPQSVVQNINYDKNTGDILFIDNRGPLKRENGQNEEIKIIIQL
jgi:hypothetical protein